MEKKKNIDWYNICCLFYSPKKLFHMDAYFSSLRWFAGNYLGKENKEICDTRCQFCSPLEGPIYGTMFKQFGLPV